MRKRVLPTFGTRAIASVTSTEVKAWIASLEAARLAPTTIRICYQLLARVFSEAVDAGLIAVSPCRRVALPGDIRREPALLTPEHVSHLAAVIEPRYRVLVLAAGYTGLRWGELAGLRIERVDFLRRRVDVAEILVEVDGNLSFGPPKTRTSRASVSFPPVPRRRAQRPRRNVPGPRPHPRPRVHQRRGHPAAPIEFPAARLAARTPGGPTPRPDTLSRPSPRVRVVADPRRCEPPRGRGEAPPRTRDDHPRHVRASIPRYRRAPRRAARGRVRAH